MSILSISDSLINQGENIRFTVVVHAEVARTYTFTACLFKDGGENQDMLGVNNDELYLSTENNSIIFDFDATKMKGEGINGPYDFTLYAADEFYGSHEHALSQAYSLSQIASPDVCFAGDFIFSYPAGTPGASTPNSSSILNVAVPLSVASSNNYTIAASIWNDTYDMVDGMIINEYLAIGAQNFELAFSLDRIAEFDIVGPYKIFASILDENETLLFSKVESIAL